MLLVKYDIQGIIDRNEKIQAIIDKITANQKFNNVIDKFYNSKFNKPLTGEDYNRAKKALDLMFQNYVNEEYTVDKLFEIPLPSHLEQFKIDEDTYKVTYGENFITFFRHIVTGE